MDDTIVIYGKDGWPYTQRAREAHTEHVYVDVTRYPDRMAEMLRLSDGQRKVPVIVSGSQVTVGYNGSWRI